MTASGAIGAGIVVSLIGIVAGIVISMSTQWLGLLIIGSTTWIAAIIIMNGFAETLDNMNANIETMAESICTLIEEEEKE